MTEAFILCCESRQGSGYYLMPQKDRLMIKVLQACVT